MSVSASRNMRAGRSKTTPRAAFYDLDGTLVQLNLVHSALFIMANIGEWTGRAGYLLSFATRAPRLLMAERKDRRTLNSVLFEAFKGLSSDRLFSLGEEYCDRVLRKHLYPRAVEMLNENRDAGLEPVLVTGSPDFIVAPLARLLGVRDFAANRLAMLAGRATGRLLDPVMASDEKAHWCARYAAERGIRLSDCWGYADSHYDLPFLAALGHPVAVNPDRKLRAAAINRQWPLISFDPRRDSDAATDFAAGRVVQSRGNTADGAS